MFELSQLHNVIGTIGVAMIVGAYGLNQLGKLDSLSSKYQLINAVGAAAVLVSLTVDFNFSAFVVEAFWLLISIAGLLRSRKPAP